MSCSGCLLLHLWLPVAVIPAAIKTGLPSSRRGNEDASTLSLKGLVTSLGRFAAPNIIAIASLAPRLVLAYGEWPALSEHLYLGPSVPRLV